MNAPARHANGLTADDYVRVARPTLEVAALTLDALRRTGIAAWTSVPDDTDRCELWADAHELDDVRTVLAAVLRGADLPATDLGAVTEEAVLAELGEPPADLDLDEDDDGPSDSLGTRNPTPSARPYPTPSRPRPPQKLPDPPADLADLADFAEDDDDDHFEPDEPESLRTLSHTTVWALAILAVGVVALALSGLAPTLVGAYGGLTSLLGTAAVLVGVGMLVTRLRDGRRDDGGGNDGGPNGDGAVL